MHQVYYNCLQEYTETYTRFTMGTWSRAHCTYNSECNILFIWGSLPFIFCSFFPPIQVVFLYISIQFTPFHPTPKLHGSLDISFVEVFFLLFLFNSQFTNTTCIETLHRPICFRIHFFLFLNSPHEPATYIHNAFLF